ncbi:MAG: element excision factor XisI family protein [Rhizonema sp. PD38]|nr:element excision factor XisI family protein [Rhizonema sp. PD38]
MPISLTAPKSIRTLYLAIPSNIYNSFFALQFIQSLIQQNQLRLDERIQAQIIVDTEKDHYLLLYVGWRNQKRVYGPVLHLDNLGVPKQNIVLAFDPPLVRQFTDFSVG